MVAVALGACQAARYRRVLPGCFINVEGIKLKFQLSELASDVYQRHAIFPQTKGFRIGLGQKTQMVCILARSGG